MLLGGWKTESPFKRKYKLAYFAFNSEGLFLKLEVNWNAKFDNFNNEYINLLNWNFEANFEQMWTFTKSIFNKLKT